jgi:hypothetical protein
MGTDIHTFVEYADDSGRRSFSGRPEEPAWLFGKFSLLRDYALFDALGDGRNSQMAPADIGKRALYPPRGIAPDLSLEAAREYYDLVVEAQTPHAGFWPKHGCVSVSQAHDRVQKGAHFGSVVQTIHYGTTPPQTWHGVSKEFWHTPSWLTVEEVHQSLEHHRLSMTTLRWDFLAMLKSLSAIEEQIGRGQVRVVFWFDN